MITTTEFYDRWVAALKSGKYQHHLYQLRSFHDIDRYCCLGVACDIYDDNQWELNPRKSEFRYKGEVCVLPATIINKLDLRFCGGVFYLDELSPQLQAKLREINIHNDDGTSPASDLVQVNDRSTNFDLIIEILEERPPSLFESPGSIS